MVTYQKRHDVGALAGILGARHLDIGEVLQGRGLLLEKRIADQHLHGPAAREFLEYLTIDPQGNAESAEVAGIAPTNKEAYADYAESVSAVGGEATANFGAIMQYQLENNAVHRPAVVGYSVFEPGANQLFSDIRNGSDPAERAAQADKDIETQIDRLK